MDILLQLPTQTSRFAQIKTLRTEVLSVCTLIFRFPAGFGTLCVIHTGCRASQGLSPQPLLISRYSVVSCDILSFLRQIVKRKSHLFQHFSGIDAKSPPVQGKTQKRAQPKLCPLPVPLQMDLSSPWPARRSGSSRRGKCPDGPRPEPGISPCRPRWRCRRQP